MQKKKVSRRERERRDNAGNRHLFPWQPAVALKLMVEKMQNKWTHFTPCFIGFDLLLMAPAFFFFSSFSPILCCTSSPFPGTKQLLPRMLHRSLLPPADFHLAGDAATFLSDTQNHSRDLGCSSFLCLSSILSSIFFPSQLTDSYKTISG